MLDVKAPPSWRGAGRRAVVCALAGATALATAAPAQNASEAAVTAELMKIARIARHLASEDYCVGQLLQPRVASTIAYLDAFDKWLAAERKVRSAHLRALLDEQVIASNLAADAQKGVSYQQALLETADAIDAVVSFGGSLQGLFGGLDPKFTKGPLSLLKGESPLQVDSGAPPVHLLDEGEVQAPLVSGPLAWSKSMEMKGTFMGLAAQFETASRQIRENPKLANDPEIMACLSTGTKAISAGYAFYNLELPAGTNATALLETFLKEIAKLRQADLIDQMRDHLALENLSKTKVYEYLPAYQALAARHAPITEALEILRNVTYDAWPCRSVCPKDDKPPRGMAFGGSPFDTSGKKSYSTELPKFTPAVTNAYAASMWDVIAAWDAKRNDLPTLQIKQRTPPLPKSSARVPKFKAGEAIEYEGHVGWSCHGAELSWGGFHEGSDSGRRTEVFDDENGRVSGTIRPKRADAYTVELRKGPVVDGDRILSGPDPPQIATAAFEIVSDFDNCLVGRWKADKVTDLKGQYFGGSGFEVTFKEDGTQAIDYSLMQKLVFGTEKFEYSGSAEAKISTSEKVAKVESIVRSELKGMLTTIAMPEPVPFTVFGIGPGGLGGTKADNGYVCTRETLTYKTSVAKDGHPNFQVELRRVAP